MQHKSPMLHYDEETVVKRDLDQEKHTLTSGPIRACMSAHAFKWFSWYKSKKTRSLMPMSCNCNQLILKPFASRNITFLPQCLPVRMKTSLLLLLFSLFFLPTEVLSSFVMVCHSFFKLPNDDESAVYIVCGAQEKHVLLSFVYSSNGTTYRRRQGVDLNERRCPSRSKPPYKTVQLCILTTIRQASVLKRSLALF